MGVIPFWRPPAVEPERTVWDIVYLNGKDLPGVCTCVIDPERKVEIVHEKKTDGVTQTDNGYKGAKIEITCTIWNQEQLGQLNEQIPNFHPRKPGNKSGPVSLEHPAALLLGVTGIRVTKLKVPAPTGGLMVMLISGFEWFPDTKPSKSRDTTGGFPPKTAGGTYTDDIFTVPPKPTTGANFPG